MINVLDLWSEISKKASLEGNYLFMENEDFYMCYRFIENDLISYPKEMRPFKVVTPKYKELISQIPIKHENNS